MKNNLLLLVFLFAAFSCTKEQVDNKEIVPGGAEVQVSGFDENSLLKTTMSGSAVSWTQTTDVIGIYSDHAILSTTGGAVANLNYKADNPGVSTTFSTVGTATMQYNAVN
ncbi:MAG: hypothetical protein LWW85_13155, partial [Marinilabiliales bacterium]|nr:hypothetical protein [Marinilabiliales bacterium]